MPSLIQDRIAIGAATLSLFALAISLSEQPAPAIDGILSVPEQTEAAAPKQTEKKAEVQKVEDASWLDEHTGRVAERMHGRLQVFSTDVPSVKEIVTALEDRRELLTKSMHIAFETVENPEFVAWDVSLHRYPLWLRTEIADGHIRYTVDAWAVTALLDAQGVEGIVAPVDTVLNEIVDSAIGSRAVTEGVAKRGLWYDKAALANKIVSFFEASEEREEVMTIALEDRAGSIVNKTGQDLGELTLLATGKSDFAGSGYGRIANVRKGLREHLHNTVVAPGEEFSFNSLLEEGVGTGNGWYMAYVIFNGKDLEMAPGGGICQVSTTFYRALLNAGFPIVKQKNHSLYVTYYEKYGVGLDATIFPGKQDLTFVNDSPGHLVVQAYDDGFDVTVNIYGTPDGRSVALRGPYFTETAPEGLQVNGRDIARSEIVWVREIKTTIGEKKEEVLVSRYNSVPLRIRNEYIAEHLAEQETMYSAAE